MHIKFEILPFHNFLNWSQFKIDSGNSKLTPIFWIGVHLDLHCLQLPKSLSSSSDFRITQWNWEFGIMGYPNNPITKKICDLDILYLPFMITRQIIELGISQCNLRNPMDIFYNLRVASIPYLICLSHKNSPSISKQFENCGFRADRACKGDTSNCV